MVVMNSDVTTMAETTNEPQSKARRGKAPGAEPRHGRQKLTDSVVKAMKLPAAGAYEVRDTEVTGLSVLVSFGGTKSWWLNYTYPRGKGGIRRRWRLGTFSESRAAGDAGKSGNAKVEDARRRARHAWDDLQLGIDPAAAVREAHAISAARREEPTWADLCRRYIKEQASPSCKPRTVRLYERLIANFLLSQWGPRKAKDVVRADVKELIGEVRGQGKNAQANQVQVLIGAICAFGVREEILAVNPAVGIERVALAPRERILSAEEIRLLWPLLDAPLRLLLLTGQRNNEVVEMGWKEIDLDAGTWTLPGPRSKNGKKHLIPLVGEAARILRELPRSDNGRVFPVGIRRSFDRARAASGIEDNFTIHDLRRTVVSRLSELGVLPIVVSKIVNHAERTNDTTQRVYNQYEFQKEKRDALTKWGRELERIVSGAKATVTDIASARDSA